MRLWHKDLISQLPRQQLLGQWRECIALLGNGWGKKHSVVDYVFKYPLHRLYLYTIEISKEMKIRGYKPNEKCITDALNRRGINLLDVINSLELRLEDYSGSLIYPEHNEEYMQECIQNLKGKGIIINAG